MDERRAGWPRNAATRTCLALALVVLAPWACAQEANAVDVIVYSAPKMFFSSPELVPTLGPLVALGAPDRPTFGTDPGSRFAWALGNLLMERGLPALEISGDVVTAPPSRKRIENPGGTPHVIVLTTMNFLGYRPLGWKTYQYGYGAYVRITDGDANTIGEANCIVKPTEKNPDLQLGRERLQEPGAFDAIVDRATLLCAQQLVDDVASSLALVRERTQGQPGSAGPD